MPPNQETIEAKLCAYIDDELDAAGRAEIEKHLAANPQHRRLIEELRRTSALVHNLPHDSAPPELAEAFNAQLERSVLLQGVSEATAGADIRLPRWPQIVAMAAITLLTVGLAVVVYVALPASGRHAQLVQVVPRPVTEGGGSQTDQTEQLGERNGGLGVDRKADRDKFAAAAPSPLAAAPSLPAGAVGGAIRSASADQASAPIVLVVHSNDPGLTRKALVTYLVQQDVPWEPAVAPTDAETIHGTAPTTQPAEALADAAPPVASASRQLEAAGNAPAPLAPTTLPADQVQKALPAVAQTQPADIAVDDLAAAKDVRLRLARPAVSEFCVSCKLTTQQVDALRSNLSESGASLDPLPPGQSDAVLEAVDAIPASTPSLPGPATAPVAGPEPEIALGQIEPATQPAGGSLQSTLSARTPTTAPSTPIEAPLQLLIIVRPAEAPATQPAATTAPSTQPTDATPATTQP